MSADGGAETPHEQVLTEPAERALLDEVTRQAFGDRGGGGVRGELPCAAFTEAAAFGPAVDRFFTEVFVMVDDLARVRQARLRLMKRVERLVSSSLPTSPK